MTFDPEKEMGMFRKSVLAVACLAATSLASANLLLNGDFEADDPDVTSGGFTPVGAGALTIDSWTVSGTSVDLIQNNYGSISNVSVDLAGSPGPGKISQSFAATAGYLYTLKWDYFKNGSGTDLTVTLGSSSQVFAPPSSITPGALTWTAPSSGSFFVSFNSDGGNQGPTVDNIVLTAVPEPASMALALAGLGIVGAAARRRRHGR